MHCQVDRESLLTKQTSSPKETSWSMDPCTHKTGRPQLMCNNNSYDALFAFLPELAEDDQGLFKKWISLAAEEDMWNNYMSLLTDFQKCGIENVLQCICLANKMCMCFSFFQLILPCQWFVMKHFYSLIFKNVAVKMCYHTFVSQQCTCTYWYLWQCEYIAVKM